jgi:hypothetical protein
MAQVRLARELKKLAAIDVASPESLPQEDVHKNYPTLGQVSELPVGDITNKDDGEEGMEYAAGDDGLTTLQNNEVPDPDSHGENLVEDDDLIMAGSLVGDTLSGSDGDANSNAMSDGGGGTIKSDDGLGDDSHIDNSEPDHTIKIFLPNKSYVASLARLVRTAAAIPGLDIAGELSAIRSLQTKAASPYTTDENKAAINEAIKMKLAELAEKVGITPKSFGRRGSAGRRRKTK